MADQPAIPPSPAVPCCAAPDAPTSKPCALCSRPCCRNCRKLANGVPVCAACGARLASDLANERADMLNLPSALAGGVAAALVAGAVWAGIAIATNLAIGYVAIGVGWLAGQGVRLGSGDRRGFPLQVAAVGCAVLGLLLGKYGIVAHAVREFVVKQGGTAPSWVNPAILRLFVENFGSFINGFDALWVIFALAAAWGVVKPTGVEVK